MRPGREPGLYVFGKVGEYISGYILQVKLVLTSLGLFSELVSLSQWKIKENTLQARLDLDVASPEGVG